MIKRAGLILLTIFAVSVNLAQEKKLFWDGNDWVAIDRVTAQNPEFNFWVKNAYLSGMFDSRLFYRIKALELQRDLADSLFNDLLAPTSSRRLIQGLDAFYRDLPNRYLPVPCALIAALMIQNDVPAAEINRYIENSKRWINDLLYKLPPPR